MLPSKIDQMKVSHETGSEANFGFGRALMPSYLGMLLPKAAFFSFGCSHCVLCPGWEMCHFSQSKLIYLSLSLSLYLKSALLMMYMYVWPMFGMMLRV